MNLFTDQPKEKVQKIALVALAGLIATGAIYQFYIVYQRTALREAGKTVVRLQQEIQDVQRQATRATINEVVRQQVNGFAEQQLQGMIEGDPFAWVVRSVSLLSQNQPVKILNWRPGATAKHGRLTGYETFTTRLDIEGRYDQIGAFVQELENRFPTGEVRYLDLVAGKDGVHRAGIDLLLLLRPKTNSPQKKDTKEARS